MALDIAKMRADWAASDAQRDEGLKEPASVEKIRNLSYGPHGVENLYDVYYPVGTTSALPTIINFHGGGFCYGDKELYRFYAMNLATYGFTVVNFNYRLSPETLYPAPLEDISALFFHLHENTSAHFVDLTRLFFIGDSAGAQLAEQYSTILTNPAYAALFSFSIPIIKPKAVALNCGLYGVGTSVPIPGQFNHYFGDTLAPEEERQFPVEEYITKDFPPAYVMTSSDDFLRDAAKPLADLLEADGVKVEYHLYANPDQSRLGHVFHVNQKLDIAKECTENELQFFKSFLS